LQQDWTERLPVLNFTASGEVKWFKNHKSDYACKGAQVTLEAAVGWIKVEALVE
jgi:hypothetical protein